MSRPNDESGLDGLGILEDDLILDDDLETEEVHPETPAPRRAVDVAAPVVMPVAHEVDPTMRKRITILAICVVVFTVVIGVLVGHVIGWWVNQ